jgi:hypothetical protein
VRAFGENDRVTATGELESFLEEGAGFGAPSSVNDLARSSCACDAAPSRSATWRSPLEQEIAVY